MNFVPHWTWWIQSLLTFKMSESGPNTFVFRPLSPFFTWVLFVRNCTCSHRMCACVCSQYWICWMLDSDMLMAVDLLLPATMARSSCQHVSNIKTGQGRGCRTAQLLNHPHTFSRRHVCEAEDTKMLQKFVFSIILGKRYVQQNFTKHCLNQAHMQTDARQCGKQNEGS